MSSSKTSQSNPLPNPDIQVVQYFKSPGSYYIGRGSILGNPFRMYSEDERDKVCDDFSDYLNNLIEEKNPDIEQELQSLVDLLELGQPVKLGCFCAPRRCHGDKIKEVVLSMFTNQSKQTPVFKYSRHSGYEVSTAGDKRFSAFCAILQDGRSIEQHYQCCVKGYDPKGTNWKLGKGKPPIAYMTHAELYDKYLALWKEWAQDHPEEMKELRIHAIENNYTLRDRFASGLVNQARALAQILTETIE